MMQIGYVPSPREWERWPEAEALLEPARALADYDMEILPDGHSLWAVLDGEELLAVATTRRTTDRRCEVLLVGGRDYRRWLGKLDQVIGAAHAEAGYARIAAFGRRGWARELQRNGWVKLSEDADGFCVYSRELGEAGGQERI